MWANSDGGQDIIIRHDMWDDPGAWGLVLVDIARHVARAQAQAGADESEVFSRILELFQAELDNPTDEPTGNIEE